MPIAKGWSRETVSRNIRMLIREGYSHKQATAIALESARRARKESAVKNLRRRRRAKRKS